MHEKQLDLFEDQPTPQKNSYPEVYELFLKDMETRYAIGLQRYGVALQPFNGRDMLRDTYEELLDACLYVRGALYERDKK